MTNNNKTGWIYHLKREQILPEIVRRNLETTGTVDELRKRLSDFIKTNPIIKEINTMSFTDQESQTEFTNSTAHNMDRPIVLHQPTDVDILETVRKWNINYDGGNEATEFLERIEELAELYNIPVDRLTRTLPEKLRNRALEWYRNNHLTWQNWDDFRTAFQNHFLSRRHRIKLEDDIRRRTQGTREKGKDYVTSLQTMFRRLGDTTEADQLERIYDNLRIEYRMYIRRQDFRTLTELTEYIEQYEDLINESPRTTSHGLAEDTTKSTHGPVRIDPTKTQKTTNPFQTPTQQFNRTTDCWRCGQTGHTRFQCSNAPIALCSQCGQHGDFRQCPCRAGNELRGPTNNYN